jgi:hypothetical protein
MAAENVRRRKWYPHQEGGHTVGSPALFIGRADAAVFTAVSEDGSDLLRAGAPGVTISGAPALRCARASAAGAKSLAAPMEGVDSDE